MSVVGYTTTIHKAISYEEAKQLFKENKYDVVLLDIDLPGDGSIELLKNIRRTGRNTFVILMFSYVDKYLMKQCKTIGVDFVFDKYYDFEKIRDLLKACQ